MAHYKIAHYFKTYPTSNACFETADGFLFHKETDAQAHAATLTDKAVEEHKRGDQKPAKAEKEPKADKKKDDDKADKDGKEK